MSPRALFVSFDQFVLTFRSESPHRLRSKLGSLSSFDRLDHRSNSFQAHLFRKCRLPYSSLDGSSLSSLRAVSSRLLPPPLKRVSVSLSDASSLFSLQSRRSLPEGMALPHLSHIPPNHSSTAHLFQRTTTRASPLLLVSHDPGLSRWSSRRRSTSASEGGRGACPTARLDDGEPG